MSSEHSSFWHSSSCLLSLPVRSRVAVGHPSRPGLMGVEIHVLVPIHSTLFFCLLSRLLVPARLAGAVLCLRGSAWGQSVYGSRCILPLLCSIFAFRCHSVVSLSVALFASGSRTLQPATKQKQPAARESNRGRSRRSRQELHFPGQANPLPQSPRTRAQRASPAPTLNPNPQARPHCSLPCPV